jgi:hypothetical protein
MSGAGNPVAAWEAFGRLSGAIEETIGRGESPLALVIGHCRHCGEPYYCVADHEDEAVAFHNAAPSLVNAILDTQAVPIQGLCENCERVVPPEKIVPPVDPLQETLEILKWCPYGMELVKLLYKSPEKTATLSRICNHLYPSKGNRRKRSLASARILVKRTAEALTKKNALLRIVVPSRIRQDSDIGLIDR